MPSVASSYDVIVIGTQLAPLTCGALLAKRGFRVLLVSQDELPHEYTIGDVTLPREPFALTAAGTPIARRVFAELALTQLLRRRAVHIDPAFQICTPRWRFEVPRATEILDREIEREFPEVKRPVEDFWKALDARGALLDRLMERDLLWPSQTFFEKRESARLMAELPFGKDGNAVDPLGEFPPQHPFRLAVELPARFSDGMDPDQTTGLRLMRHFGAWASGAAALEGGYAGLRSLLVDSVRTHGGQVREPEKIDAIRVKRGNATGIRVAASGEEIGATWIINGAPIGSLLRWVPDRSPFERLFEEIGEPVVRYYRYTLNLVLRKDGLPAGLSRDAFYVGDPGRLLADANALRIQSEPLDAERQLITVEALLPRRGIEDIPDYAYSVRERVLASLGEVMPFFGDHVELIDSPHDGRGAQDMRAMVSLTSSEPWTRGTATMRAIYGYPVSSMLGLSALPVRMPVKHLLCCSEQTVPGLGMEGMLLAAWSAAKVVSESDKSRDRLRRGRWGKLEL
ncbi:MAG: phytoene desaturase family protein [Sandaracinaceae bacterium]